jgi:hypothetical protein
MGLYSKFLRVSGRSCRVDLDKLSQDSEWLQPVLPLVLALRTAPTTADLSLRWLRSLVKRCYGFFLPDDVMKYIRGFFRALVPLELFGKAWSNTRISGYFYEEFLKSLAEINAALIPIPVTHCPVTRAKSQRKRKKPDVPTSPELFARALRDLEFPTVYYPTEDRPGPERDDTDDELAANNVAYQQWLEDGFCEYKHSEEFRDKIETLVETSCFCANQRPSDDPWLEFSCEDASLFAIQFCREGLGLISFNIAPRDDDESMDCLWPSWCRLDYEAELQYEILKLLEQVPMCYLPGTLDESVKFPLARRGFV